MAEKPPAFVVVDKRKFTSEGEIREGYIAPPVEEPKAAPAEEEFSSAKVVTMPPRTAEATENATHLADDLADEEMAGSASDSEPPTGTYGREGYDVDGDGPETDDPLAGLEGDEAAIGEPRSAAETAAQNTAYQQSSRELDAMLQQANPGMQKPGAVTFDHVIQSFYLSAIMAMGAGTEPGQKPRVDILGARQSIDMLSILEEKTRGNLTPQEQQLLQGITFELRMMFLDLTNAISQQALAPGRGPGGLTPGGLR